MLRRIVMLAVMALLSSPASASEPLPAFEKYQCEGDHFRSQVPTGWTRSVRTAPYADMTRVAGARFDGPPTGEGVPASIALYWYSGEKSFTTSESYIKARLGSMVREDAERGDVTEKVKIAGRNGTAFQITTFELVYTSPSLTGKPAEEKPWIMYRRQSERIAPSVTVYMDEQYMVLPAAKGYFVLHYRAPVSAVERYQAIFDRVTASFEPLDKR